MKNKERIEALEEQVQAIQYRLANVSKTTDHIEDSLRYNPSTLNPTYPIHSTYTEPNLITDWLEKNGNPEIQAKAESDLALEEVKRQVTELLKNADLPDWAEWVSIDKDGEVFYRSEKPILYCEHWESNEEIHLSYIPLNGADWKQCCWKISDLLGDVKKNFTTENSVSEKAKNDTQPDWENLLSSDDLAKVWNNLSLANQAISVNTVIHDRIKLLLERIAELESELNEANERIVKLKDGNRDLLYQQKDIMDSVNQRIFEAIQYNQQNQIEVPFWLGASNEVWLGDDITICISALWTYCRLNNIDQTKIERIILQMKSEEE